MYVAFRAAKKNEEEQKPFFIFFGGAEGARTLDLRRDRPAF